jgi:hypothetical protein
VTFLIARGYTYSVHYHLLPLRDFVTSSGLHIHHLFWGILLLIMVGFGALSSRDPRWYLRLAVVYGVALALTLDEFALWLRLRLRRACAGALLVAGAAGREMSTRPRFLLLLLGGRDAHGLRAGDR